MEVVMLGTGSPMPSTNRCGAGQLIICDDARVLVDCGWGVARRLFAAGVLPASIDTLCFTHMHSDHITDTADFMIMRWTGGARAPLTVYGPEGTRETMEGFAAALRRDIGYRLAHHGEKLTPAGIEVAVHEVPARADPVTVATVGGLLIEAFEVDHYPVVPALGFRLRAGEASVVISGDTKRCDALTNAARAADVLICEAMNMEMMRANIERVRPINPNTAALLEDAMDYHSGTTDVAAMARDAGVKKLVLSHLIPGVPDEGPLMDQFIAGMSDIFRGELVVGRDLMRFAV